MTWTELSFGKYLGLTPPRLILVDPNWFFWAIGKKAFRGDLAEQAADLNCKSRAVRICKPDPDQWKVEYEFDCDGRFLGFMFTKVTESNHRAKGSYRSQHLDFSYICRTGRRYDKTAGKALIRDFRTLYFDGKNLTKPRCEAFFSDDGNFQLAGHPSLVSG
jgi:hypothetical protein